MIIYRLKIEDCMRVIEKQKYKLCFSLFFSFHSLEIPLMINDVTFSSFTLTYVMFFP